MAKRTTHQSYLPMEIAEIILLKLPAKSLLRFQILSKSYMAMIRDPGFSRAHLELARKNHSSSFLVVNQKDKGYNYCLAKFEDQKFQLEKEASNKLPVGLDFHLMCSCNDRVLFGRRVHNGYDQYLLCDPINSSADCRVIRSPSRHLVFNHGLCHDRTEDDYKIVLVFWTGKYTVHSCKHGTWSAKKRADKLLSLEFDDAGSGVIIDGKLYWIGVAQGDCGIIYFDPTCDSLNELGRPEEYDFDRRCHPVMIDLRGHVCFGGELKLNDVIQFWLLRGGISWEKTICIDKRSNHLITGLPVWNSKCCTVGDDLVIFYTNGTYIIYNTLQDRLVQCSTSPLVGWGNLPLALILSLSSFFS